jgi:Rieske Fe-S protein
MNSPVSRRSLFARLGGVLMGLIGTTLSAPALLFLMDPLRRRHDGGKAAAVPVAREKDVPDLDRGGQPLRATVVAKNVRDAWSRVPEVKQGSVWLYRRGGELTCLSTTCPHAGCAIDYDEKRNIFACPCHKSAFGLDGVRREGPSPRDMDRLEVEVKDGEVLCRYQRFRTAISDKETI